MSRLLKQLLHDQMEMTHQFHVVPIGEYEWVEVEKPYREFLVPADMLNEYGPPQVVSDDVASDETFRGAADPEGE